MTTVAGPTVEIRPISPKELFDLVDDRCEWNCGAWTLETDGIHGELTRSSATADFSLDARALSAQARGALAVMDLYRQGTLATSQPETLRTWDHIFETAHKPYCADMF